MSRFGRDHKNRFSRGQVQRLLGIDARNPASVHRQSVDLRKAES